MVETLSHLLRVRNSERFRLNVSESTPPREAVWGQGFPQPGVVRGHSTQPAIEWLVVEDACVRGVVKSEVNQMNATRMFNVRG